MEAHAVKLHFHSITLFKNICLSIY